MNDIALLVVKYVYGIMEVSLILCFDNTSINSNPMFSLFKVIPCDIHVINWASELHWTADSSICKAQFVCLSLQSWIPHYQWKNVNSTVALLSQLMGIKKNAGKTTIYVCQKKKIAYDKVLLQEKIGWLRQ